MWIRVHYGDQPKPKGSGKLVTYRVLLDPPGTEPHAGWCGGGAQVQSCHLDPIIPSHYQSAENMLRDTRPFWTRKITEVQFLAF